MNFALRSGQNSSPFAQNNKRKNHEKTQTPTPDSTVCT